VPLHGFGDLGNSQYTAGEFISIWRRGVWIGVDLTGVSSPITSAKALARAALEHLD
jgi:hypothetical protein